MDLFDIITLIGWALIMAGLYLIDPLWMIFGAGFSLLLAGLLGATWQARSRQSRRKNGNGSN